MFVVPCTYKYYVPLTTKLNNFNSCNTTLLSLAVDQEDM